MQEERVDTEYVAEETAPHHTHPRPINLQTQIVVGVLGLIIFGSGVSVGTLWTSLTKDSSTPFDASAQSAAPILHSSRAASTTPDNPAQDTPPVNTPSLQHGMVSGYFTSYEIEVWEDLVTCHAFVVTDGTPAFVRIYTDLIADGNTLQRIDEDGNLVLNLPWETIPEKDRQRIRASTKQDMVTLRLSELPPGNKGAVPCQSLVSFDDVE